MGAVNKASVPHKCGAAAKAPGVSAVDDASAGSRRPRECRAYLFAITPLAGAFFIGLSPQPLTRVVKPRNPQDACLAQKGL